MDRRVLRVAREEIPVHPVFNHLHCYRQQVVDSRRRLSSQYRN